MIIRYSDPHSFALSSCPVIWGFPKIGGPFFGGPYNKDPTI